MNPVDCRLRKIIAELLPPFYKNLHHPTTCPTILDGQVCHVSVVCFEENGFGTVYSYVSDASTSMTYKLNELVQCPAFDSSSCATKRSNAYAQMSPENLKIAREKADTLQPPPIYGGWLFVGAILENYRDHRWIPEAIRPGGDIMQMETFIYAAVRYSISLSHATY